jgi:hypothetical protein
VVNPQTAASALLSWACSVSVVEEYPRHTATDRRWGRRVNESEQNVGCRSDMPFGSCASPMGYAGVWCRRLGIEPSFLRFQDNRPASVLLQTLT